MLQALALTHSRLIGSIALRGKEIFNTHTDYVNSYPSLLQITGYNFTGTSTTGELCAGVVKAAGVFPKNTTQHAADPLYVREYHKHQTGLCEPIDQPAKAD